MASTANLRQALTKEGKGTVRQPAIVLGAGASIPLIDFAGYLNGDPSTRRATAAAIRSAFEDFGFLYLQNHGMPRAAVDALFAQAVVYFARPAEARSAAGGYSGYGVSGLESGKPKDCKESFRAMCDRALPPTHWPPDQPAFREAMLAFHQAGTAVCRQVMAALALAFGLPDSYFDSLHEPESGSVQLIHYPPLVDALQPGQLRAGAHTDFGTISLLFHHNDAGGLEIQRLDGSWLAAPGVADAMIVNAGDLLSRWTNDQLRSVRHRVVPPEGDAAARSRYTAVRFYQPRYDALIECLPPCQGPDRPARYPPITAGEHIEGKRQEARSTSGYEG
jgi:isopenicillin N synthase-like dioxygenase